MRDTRNHLGSRLEHSAPLPPTPEEMAAEAMRRVAEELDAGHGQEAVRLFLELVHHPGRPREIGLNSWLSQIFHPGGIARLLTAMAQYPCFVCRNGYEHCELCAGCGSSDQGQACPSCIGTGRVPCDFCGGSGLATYGLFPLQFRYALLMERAGLAIALVRKLATPATVGDGIELNKEIHRLLDLNKLMAVLENATVAAQELVDSGFRSSEDVAGLLGGCNEAAKLAEEELRQTLRRIGRAHALAARAGSDQESDGAVGRAAFYHRLASGSGLAGTLLEHRFLCQAGRFSDTVNR